MKQKLFTLFFALVASVGTIFAESGTCGDNLTWDLTNGVLTISGNGAMYDYSRDAPWYAQRTSITFVMINDDVTSIGDSAFYYCTSLTSVTIGNSVTSIGVGAFYNCSSLTSVTIPNSVTSIGNYAFYDCTSLTSVTIPNSVTSIGEWSFSICRNLKKIFYTGTITDWCNKSWSPTEVSSAYDLYFQNIKIDDLVIPNSVTSIGDNAFRNCTSLTSVTIPNSVTSIESWVFSGCTSLTFVTIGNSVASIRNGAFYNCSSLTSVTIPNSVTSIGDYAFQDCSGLTSVTIPNSVTSIGYCAFRGCSKLTSVTIPNSVTKIDNYAFIDCTSMTVVVMESSSPPYIPRYGWASEVFEPSVLIYVPFGSSESYKSTSYWSCYNIHVINPTHATVTSGATSVSITCGNAEDQKHIVSCGVEGGEASDGFVLEYIGLEPKSDYQDVPIIVNTKEGDQDVLYCSFKTKSLSLTTQPSQPVSSNTAILLAETNMADVEISCGFEYKRNDAPEDMAGTKVYCPVANGLMAGRLKGLKDEVYYKYRAFYQSAAGNMYYGDLQYIFTGDVAVEFEPILYTYAAVAVKENEATLKGYALAGSEDFTEQGFEYWAESRVNKAPRRTATIGEHHTITASGISMKATLTDLDPGTVYRYRSYAKTDSKTLYGSEMTLTTQGEYQDGQAIEDLHFETPQSTKILLDGQIYILRGEHVYDAQGKMVR